MAKLVMRMQTKGFKELVQAVNDKSLTDGPILDVMKAATREGQQEAQERSRSSLVSSSMMTEATPTLGRVYSTLPQAQAAAIDRGRAPSSVRGSNQPPVDVLQAWAARRGIDSEATFAIARAIARRGIKGRFFMRRARAVMRKRLPELLAIAARDIEVKVARSTASAPWRDA